MSTLIAGTGKEEKFQEKGLEEVEIQPILLHHQYHIIIISIYHFPDTVLTIRGCQLLSLRGHAGEQTGGVGWVTTALEGSGRQQEEVSADTQEGTCPV